MEFRHLEYFLAVCEHPSITKAAESLYISQQALSRCIQGLETESAAACSNVLPREAV